MPRACSRLARTLILGATWSLATAAPAASATSPALRHFASPEHEFLGARVFLSMPDGSRRRGDRAMLLDVETPDHGTIALSYADLLYLGADYFGVAYAQIAGDTPFDMLAARPQAAEATARVNMRRNLLSFAYRGHAAYLARVRELERGLRQRLREARAGNRPLAYTPADDCAFMLATGADACVLGAGDLLHLRDYLGQYLELAARSNDHFHQAAQTAFLLGVKMALEQALHARDAQDLRFAYVLAAYAGHFGSDAFAAGHIRTDKRAINAYCAPQLAHYGFTGWSSLLLSGVLVKTMHDRDNAQGIVVTGRDAGRWHAFGDNFLPLRDNDPNMERAVAALQFAVDSIHAAYRRRDRRDAHACIAETLRQLTRRLPDLAATAADTTHNPPPLFQAQGAGMLWNDPELGARPLDCAQAVRHYVGALGGLGAQAAGQLGTMLGAAAPEVRRAAPAARRSIDVTIERASWPGAGPLVCEWARRDHGDFPATTGAFGARATAHLESNGIGTGAEADLYCLVLAPDLRSTTCQFTEHFDNPFIGGDKHHRVAEQGACRVDVDDRGRGDHWRPRIRISQDSAP